MNNNYLMHHGVKGMKWGVRKQIQARNRFKKARKANSIDNYKRVSEEWSKKAKEADKRDSIRFSKAQTPTQIRKAESISYKQNQRLMEKGKYEVRKAMLLDAGYSKKEADIGAKWMQQKQYNMSWTDDTAWRFKGHY